MIKGGLVWKKQMLRRMEAMDWDKLRVFHTVAEAGSFTRAGDILNFSQSAVSRQISALEDSLGTPLFYRHARGLILTDQGELLFETTRRILFDLRSLDSRLDEQAQGVSGPLTITTTRTFGSLWLTPRLKRLTDRYPGLDLTLILNDAPLDLTARQADLAVRFAPSEQPDLIQRHLITMSYQIYASPEYLATCGSPQTLADLDSHRIITYATDQKPVADDLNWLLTAGRDPHSPPRAPVLQINDLHAVLRAVESGQGIAALPAYFAGEASALVRLLAEVKTPELGLYFVYTKEMRQRKRVEIFRDFLLAELSLFQHDG